MPSSFLEYVKTIKWRSFCQYGLISNKSPYLKKKFFRRGLRVLSKAKSLPPYGCLPPYAKIFFRVAKFGGTTMRETAFHEMNNLPWIPSRFTYQFRGLTNCWASYIGGWLDWLHRCAKEGFVHGFLSRKAVHWCIKLTRKGNECHCIYVVLLKLLQMTNVFWHTKNKRMVRLRYPQIPKREAPICPSKISTPLRVLPLLRKIFFK